MGRSLGYHDSDELDRPELNKCPDCQCFFATEECPLCGKICPEEFRAGNRAKVKPPKKGRNSSGRVQFINWYHSWWFILLMLYFMPIVGLVLFFTSPHSKKSKIIAGAIVVALYALGLAVTLGGGLWGLFEDVPVNDRISREEYVAKCEEIDVEAYYRNPYDEGRYLTMELEVLERVADPYVDIYDSNGGETYYRCRSLDSSGIEIYVQDYNLGEKVNFLPGDRIRIFGESGGMTSLYWEQYPRELPCIRMAYAEIVE